MRRKAEEREKRLRSDLEHLRSQQEQTLGTLDTRIDAMLERRTQAIMETGWMVSWETAADPRIEEHTRERLVES